MSMKHAHIHIYFKVLIESLYTKGFGDHIISSQKKLNHWVSKYKLDS